MRDMRISDMLRMQRELYELHRDQWLPLQAEYGRNYILWMMEEVGECIAIIKKKGDAAIMENEQVRQNFCEEMSDVLMYFNDTLLRYGITAEELSEAYVRKHAKNMGRDYEAEYLHKYE